MNILEVFEAMFCLAGLWNMWKENYAKASMFFSLAIYMKTGQK